MPGKRPRKTETCAAAWVAFEKLDTSGKTKQNTKNAEIINIKDVGLTSEQFLREYEAVGDGWPQHVRPFKRSQTAQRKLLQQIRQSAETDWFRNIFALLRDQQSQHGHIQECI